MKAAATRVDEVGRILRRYAVDVEHEMSAVVDAAVADPWMRGAIGYHLGWASPDFQPLTADIARSGGKKLRPAIALLAYQGTLYGRNAGVAVEDIDPALPFAAGVEFFHNFSLIHDDIQDAARSRWGRPTLWTICGSAEAMNVGDCLQAIALNCFDRLLSRGVDAARVVELVSALAKTSVELATGQHHDLAFETQDDVELASYLEMIGGKTATLMRYAAYGGALLAIDPSQPGGPDVSGGLADFATHLGLAFQIHDDVLGIWGTEAETGKSTGGDIRRKKKSLPIVFAFQESPADVSDRLRLVYSQPDELTIEQETYIRQVLDSTGALAFARNEAQLHRDHALFALEAAAGGVEALSTNPFLTDLRCLADFAISRQS